MKAANRTMGAILLLIFYVSTVPAQRARTVEDTPKVRESKTAKAAPSSAGAPQPVKAKYEGGLFGYPKKVDGTLSFDDVNRRLLFRRKNQTELFSISYEAVAAAFADTQSKRPKAAGAIGGASIYTLPALLIKKKYRYLTLQYKDPDTQASGTTSFKLQNKEILTSVLSELVDKAGLTPRGEVFVRRKDLSATPATQ